MYLPLFVGVLCTPLFWYALLYVLSSFAIILRKRQLVALHLLCFGCLVTVNVLWFSLTVSWVVLQFLFLAFLTALDHTHLLFQAPVFKFKVFTIYNVI